MCVCVCLCEKKYVCVCEKCVCVCEKCEKCEKCVCVGVCVCLLVLEEIALCSLEDEMWSTQMP